MKFAEVRRVLDNRHVMVFMSLRKCQLNFNGLCIGLNEILCNLVGASCHEDFVKVESVRGILHNSP
jgi:hypothetical protein